MKKYAYNDITLMQYIFLIHGAQVGIGVLSLPRLLAESAGTDGWISILFGWILSTGASLMIVQVMKRYPNATLIELLILYFGKWIGKAAALLIALYFSLFTTVVILMAIAITKTWILPQTAHYVVMMLLLFPGYIILRHGIRVVGRYSELVFFMTLWMPMILIFSLQDAHWLHLLPVIKEGWSPILQTVQSTVFSFLGFEIAFFLYPFVKHKQAASIGIVVANTLSMLFFLHVTIVAFVFFAPNEIFQYKWPTLSLLKVIEFRFLERFDIVFLISYLFIISTTWMPLMFFVVFTTAQLMGKQDHSRHLYVFLSLLIVVSFFYIPSLNQIVKLEQLNSRLGFNFAYVFPVFLWLYGKLYDRFRTGGSK